LCGHTRAPEADNISINNTFVRY